jgi:hypothetical protein
VFSFQHAEEALDQSIVWAATYSAHAANQVMAIQELLIFVAGELATPVGMQNYRETIRQCPCPDGNSQQVLQGHLTIRGFPMKRFSRTRFAFGRSLIYSNYGTDPPAVWLFGSALGLLGWIRHKKA